MGKALRRRARSEIRARCVEIDRALGSIPRDADTAASLIAMGIEMAEDLKHKPDDLIRLCTKIVEAPRAADPRSDTWGT
jgi:hypothetical protein